MDERVIKTFTKEEEFLDEFGDTANVAVRLLNDEWYPNYSANDAVRANIKYFFSTGEVNYLAFDSASIYHDQYGFSSVQIILRSSKRVINVRVKKVDNELIGEIIVERLLDKTNT